MNSLEEIAKDIGQQIATDPGASQQAPKGVADKVSARLSSLSIGRKITLFFSVNLFFALVAGFTVVLAFVEINARVQVTTDIHQKAFVAERIVVKLSDAKRHSESMLTSEMAMHGTAALADLERADTSLVDIKAWNGAQSQRYADQIDLLDSEIDQWRGQISTYLQDPKAAASLNLIDGEMASGIKAAQIARNLAADIQAETQDQIAYNDTMIISMLFIWIGLAGTLVLMTLIAQRFFDQHVGGALSHLAHKMSQLSSGNDIGDIQASTRSDEIGEMTRALAVFHRASVRLNELNQERSERAQEELEERAHQQRQEEEARQERQRELSDIVDQFERTIGDVVTKVASASSELQSTATSMATGAQQAANQISEVTNSMQEANSGATAAAAASDQFAMSIGEVSRQATSAAELARKTSSSTKQADETITKLAESASEVGHIVELIQTIAHRTNLLALNASIEAARGGASGRGFAVVASEVKELAMQTSRATEEVADLIRAMQDTTGASVSALQAIANQVSELENNASSIANAVNEQSFAGQDLARSIDMAARGTENVAGHITEVHELSTSTGSAASQVLSSATALEQQATTLHAQLNDFLDEVRAS